MGKALEAFKENGLSKSSQPNQWDTKPLITFEPLEVESRDFTRDGYVINPRWRRCRRN